MKEKYKKESTTKSCLRILNSLKIRDASISRDILYDNAWMNSRKNLGNNSKNNT